MWGQLQWLQLGSGKGDECLKAGRHQVRLGLHSGVWGQPALECKAAAREGRAPAVQSGPLGR